MRDRPVFQSYSAYTPVLAELNGEFINGPLAPRFVLSRWTSIDRRFPPADDALTLLGLLQRYRPVLRERDYVLLERDEGEAPPQDRGIVVLNARTQRGVRVALPTEAGALYTLAVIVRPTIAARLARLVYRAPRLPFVVELESGTRRSYELVSAVAAVPFVISPVLDESGDLSSLYEARGARAVAVTIAGHCDGSLKYFADDIEIRLVRYRWPPDR